MNTDRLKASCRLCLSNETEYFIDEDYITEKINILLGVETHNTETLPNRICGTCRNQLERLYVFRVKSQESDTYLRKTLLPKTSIKERVQASIQFLKNHDSSFVDPELNNPMSMGHQVQDRSSGTKLTPEETESIERAVQSTLQQSGYNGRFAINIEEIDEQGLRRVRVVKENGNNVLMKLRMPARPDASSTLSPAAKKIKKDAQIESIEELIKKCDRIEDMQDRVFRSVIRTEKVVFQINEQIHTSKLAESGFEITDVQRDDDAPFVFPISHLSELWRLNTRLADPEVRDLLTEEMSKIEASAGSKISGKIFRSLIAKGLISKICWSGRIKDGQKYVKSDDKVMLSKMKYLVEWMYSIVVAKEPDTTMQTFLQTIMNIIRKERFKSKDSTGYLEDTEYLNDDYDEGQFIHTDDQDVKQDHSIVMITDI